jgi:putative ABC transport system substrate-binding protein
VPRVGYLVSNSASPTVESFREGLRELGYVDGHNIVIEYRYAEFQPERLSVLAAELVGLPVDVIAASSVAAAVASKQATSTIPIVVMAGDLIASGLVTSLARPADNVTGVTSMARQMNGKRLELLREALPGVSRVAVLWNPDSPSASVNREQTESAAGALGLALQFLEVRDLRHLQAVFQRAREYADAMLILGDPLFFVHTAQLADLAAQNRLPAMSLEREFAEAGGLMAYGASATGLTRRAAYYVDKILKGAKPADLPVEQPREFDFIINLKTAQALGLTIPQHVLLQATEVIQ